LDDDAARLRVDVTNERLSPRRDQPADASESPLLPALDAWLASERFSFSFTATIEGSEEKIMATRSGNDGQVSLSIDGVAASREVGSPASQVGLSLVFALYNENRVIAQKLFGSILNMLVHLDRFDEALGTFENLTNRGFSVQLADGGRRVVSALGIMPDSMENAIFAQLRNDPDLERIQVESDEVVFLREMVAIAGFKAATLRFDRVAREPIDDPKGGLKQTYGRLAVLFRLPGGVEFDQTGLSYGQKRLLAFLYYLEMNLAIAIADELVNGLHHEWIRICLDKLETRQSFLTSQNPLLIDYLEFASKEDVCDHLIICDLASQGRRGPDPARQGWSEFVWRKPSDNEADAFFDAYRAGVLHGTGAVVVTDGERVVRFRVHPEDGSSHALKVLERIAKKMLKQVDPKVQTHKLSFDILQASRKCAKPSDWGSQKQCRYQDKVALQRSVASALAQKQVVLFHYDGDVAWSCKDNAHNAKTFDAEIRAKVRATLATRNVGVFRSQGRSAPRATSRTEDEVNQLLTRLVDVVPYYSIEAWLYQNTRDAIALCDNHCNGADVGQFKRWAADRSLLDEVERPKDNIRLGSRFNEQLASGIPAEDVLAVGKSWAAVVERLRNCEALRCDLRKTWDP
jgi:hypothetical protein